MSSNRTHQVKVERDNNLATPLLHPNDSENEPYCDDGLEIEAVWLCCGTTWDYFLQVVVSILLPALLAIQFHLAASVENFSHYPMMFLYMQIFFFGVAAWLYRTSLQGDECIVIQLWPEISIDILLMLILCQQTAIAIFLLDVTSLALAIHAAWNYWDQLDYETTHSKDNNLAQNDESTSGCETQTSKDSSEMPLATAL
jgi:hypothetical protein